MLKVTVEKLIEEMEKLEKNLMGMFDLSDLAEVDDETIKMFKSYVNLMNISKELMVEQAATIDNMNDKLNEINSKLDVLSMK